jgi:hypothetical protein
VRELPHLRRLAGDLLRRIHRLDPLENRLFEGLDDCRAETDEIGGGLRVSDPPFPLGEFATGGVEPRRVFLLRQRVVATAAGSHHGNGDESSPHVCSVMWRRIAE